METFHLFHLASCWNARSTPHESHPSPLTTTAVQPNILRPPSTPLPAPTLTNTTPLSAKSAIKAAAVHMTFASRTSQEFITPQQVLDLEAWAGRRVLTALCAFHINDTVGTVDHYRFLFDTDSSQRRQELHPEEQSVWKTTPDTSGS